MIRRGMCEIMCDKQGNGKVRTNMNQRKYKLRKISKVDFDKLYDSFPDREQMWLQYRNMRLKEFDHKEIHVYVIELNSVFIGELTINYVSHDLKTEAIPNQSAYLQAFRVDKKYQGLGLGQKLIQFVLPDLERKGYTDTIDKGYGDEFDSSDYTFNRSAYVTANNI